MRPSLLTLAKMQELIISIAACQGSRTTTGFSAIVPVLAFPARVTVALAPIIPGHSYTPTAAALHLIQMIRVWQRGSAHFVMDSAFATEEMVNSARSMNVAVSLSMKSNRTAGYAPVYELATSRLEPGEARSYAFDGYIMQTRCAAKPHKRGGLPVHAVLSSGWRTPPHGSAPIKRLLDYVSVKTLYLNNTCSGVPLREYQKNRTEGMTLPGFQLLDQRRSSSAESS